MSAQRILGSFSKCLIHPVAWLGLLGSKKLNPIDRKMLIDQFVQILPFGNNISPENIRTEMGHSKFFAKPIVNGDVEKGDLPLVILFKIEKAISADSTARDTFDLIDGFHRMAIRLLTVMAKIIVIFGNIEL